MSRAAAFLDRDGVLVEERGYITQAAQLRLLPGAAQAVRELRDQGLAVVMVSNQSAVARGLLRPAELDELHRALRAMLAEGGAVLDGVYACPHHPEGVVAELRLSCACRKPAPGLLRQAARELDLALDARSVLAGDQWTDLQAAQAAGVRGVLVRTGKGRLLEERARRELPDVAVIDSLAELPAFLSAQRTTLASPERA